MRCAPGYRRRAPPTALLPSALSGSAGRGFWSVCIAPSSSLCSDGGGTRGRDGGGGRRGRSRSTGGAERVHSSPASLFSVGSLGREALNAPTGTASWQPQLSLHDVRVLIVDVGNLDILKKNTAWATQEIATAQSVPGPPRCASWCIRQTGDGKGREVWGLGRPWGLVSRRPTVGDLGPQQGPSGLGENVHALPVLSSQSEERKRIDKLIESGKEEGMKVRAAGPRVRGATATGSERAAGTLGRG